MPAPRLALATCRAHPGLDPDNRPLLPLLAACGLDASAQVWDDPAVRWADFDLVVIRSTWDYEARPADYLSWLGALPRVLNPPEAVRWSLDKRYLGELARSGLPTVPTTYVGPGGAFEVPVGRFVVKPSVGAGSRLAATFGPGDGPAALGHVRRLHGLALTAMVQPYLGGIDGAGETDVVFLGGRYSHAVRKGAMLAGGGDKPCGAVAETVTTPRDPAPAERELAEAALDAVPGGRGLLYARIDLAPGKGGPVLMEVELAEPRLFFGGAPGSAERFADLVAREAKAR